MAFRIQHTRGFVFYYTDELLFTEPLRNKIGRIGFVGVSFFHGVCFPYGVF